MKNKKWMPILLSMSVLSSMGISYAAQAEAPTGEQEQKNDQTSEITGTETSGIDLSSFEIVDLNGDTVTQDIFKDYDITMINIWATWCGPCRSELPEIQAAYEKLPENANIISICHDAADDTEIANAIVEKMGMEFAVLVPNEELDQSVFTYLMAFPTTVFVDKEGHMVGDAVIGVPAADDVTQAYLDYIDAALER